MAVVSHRASRLESFCSETAGISSLSAAIVGLGPQASPRFPFARLPFPLLIVPARSHDGTRLGGMLHTRRTQQFRSQLAVGHIIKAILQPLAHNAPRGLRYIDKLHSRVSIPVLPHDLAGKPYRGLLARQLKLKIDFAGGR